jgi:hypothetical protein
VSHVADNPPPLEDEPPLPELDRVRLLENTVFAQRWDIEGLTQQRDEAYQKLDEAERERTEAQGELDTFRLLAERRALELRQTQAAADARQESLLRMQQITLDLVTELLLSDPGQPSAEAVLLVASFLFDLPFYIRQIGQPLTLPDAVRHYLEVGEGHGLLPNPLFDAGYYRNKAASLHGWDKVRTALGHYAAVGLLTGTRPGPLVDGAWLRWHARPRPQDRFEPISWWLQVGRTSNIPPHPALDLDFYRRNRPGLRPQDDPMADFRLAGLREGAMLSPLLDTEFYLRINSDVHAAGDHPLLHYLGYGESEGRLPNPLFDPAWYRATRPTPLPDTYSALGHYMQQGVREAASTHRLFDAAWYLERNPDVRDDNEDPLRHYLGPGGRERRSPHPLFDSNHVAATMPTALHHHPNPVASFLMSEDLQDGAPHPLFDPRHYLSQVPEAGRWPNGLFDHFLAFNAKNQADPHPMFCTRYYLEQVGTLPAGQTALTHYVGDGARLGLSPHPLFDPVFYSRNNPDLAQRGSELLMHFVAFGGTMREHRSPHPLFDVRLYIDRVRGIVEPDKNLLIDFLQNWQERPSPHWVFDPAWYEAQTSEPRLHDNPLADYVWRGRHAQRGPHPLFDPVWYTEHAHIPATWARTLLEHYLARLVPETMMPHPATDGEHVAALLQEDVTANTTLLEYFVRHAASHDLDPHILFSTRSWLVRHPEAAKRGDPLSDYIKQGNRPFWQDQPSATLKARLCGIGEVAAVSPSLANARTTHYRVPEREVTADKWHSSGALFGRGKKRARLAIYAAHASAESAELHRHAVTALRQAGYAVLFVDGAPGLPGGALPQPGETVIGAEDADLVLSHSLGGQQFGAWMLACRQFTDQIGQYNQVLFATDNLVGPLGPAETLFGALDAADGTWRALTHADQDGVAVEAEWFALPVDIVKGEAFRQFVATYRFADGLIRTVEPVEQALTDVLQQAGHVPIVAAPAGVLRTAWQRAAADRLAWARSLTDNEVLADLSAARRKRLASHIEVWLQHGVQDGTVGSRLRPSMIYWEELPRRGLPLIRRDLLLANPIGSPDLLRLHDILGAEAMAVLRRLLGPILPDYPASVEPVLRVTHAFLEAR